MAKTTMKKAIKGQARRVIPAIRRNGTRAKAAAQRATLTLGELIAAAFDTVGAEVKDVASLLSSNEVACAIQKRIIFT